MDCPRCGLINPDSAQRCDCGYDFASRTLQRSYLDPRFSSSRSPRLGSIDPALISHWTDRARQGYRLVVFEYCMSFIVVTIRRRTEVQLIAPDESSLARGAYYSLISLVFGWWGIPFGPIFTISSLITNMRGGRDVTRALTGDVSEESA